MRSPLLPHVQHHLLCLVCVEGEVVVLTPWHQTGHLPTVGRFIPPVMHPMGDDCVYCGAVVHKERPDVGVFIFQVGEEIVANSSDSICGGPDGPLGVLQVVQGVWYAALNVGQNHSLKTLYKCWSGCYWLVII